MGYKDMTDPRDLRGTIAVEYNLMIPFFSTLSKKSKIPEGYSPVGLSMFRCHPTGWTFRLQAVDANSAGKKIDEIKSQADVNGILAVFEFEVDITFEDLMQMIKQVDISLKAGPLASLEFKVIQNS